MMLQARLGMLVAFGLIFVGVNINSVWLVVSMVLVFIALIIWYAHLNTQRERAGYELQDEEFARLQAQYNEKLAALDRNRRIANS
jgi:hypothetical protein